MGRAMIGRALLFFPKTFNSIFGNELAQCFSAAPSDILSDVVDAVVVCLLIARQFWRLDAGQHCRG